MKYLKSPLLQKNSTLNRKHKNHRIKKLLNTLYISFVLFAHMYYKDRLQAETGFLWFQDKNRLSLEIHANCFNMYLVVANKFSFKSGMINIYKFYNVELKLYWQIFTKS